MDEVLVVKAVKPNYNTLSGGPPIMMVGGGGGGGRGGRTWREAIGGKVGGLVGVAGALAGQHRSLGSLAQSMISGGAQGAALGGGLGRRLVGRRGQALADLKEKEKQENAQLAAEHVKEFGASGSNKNLAAQRRSYLTGVQNREQQAAQQAKIDRARQRAQARSAGFATGTQQAEDAKMTAGLRESMQGLSREQQNEAFNRFNQAAKDRFGSAQRVDPMQGVTRADDSVVPPQSLVAVGNSIPQLGENSAANEISSLENAGDQFNQNRTNQALTYKPPQEDEEGEGEEGPTLDDIQQQQRTAVVNSMEPNSMDSIQQQRRDQRQGM